MSFVLDPPLLIAAGAAIERGGLEEAAARRAEVATVAVFVGVSLAMYANAPGLGPLWRPFGARSGREFMLTSGLARVDTRRMSAGRHAAALALFAFYPAWLRIGRRLGR